MPPVWFTGEQLVPLVQLLGNYLIPFYCMASVVYLLMHAQQAVIDIIVLPLRNVYRYLAVLLGLTGLIGVLMLIFGVVQLAPAFNTIVAQRFGFYATDMIDGNLCGAYGSWGVFNVVHLLVILLFGWCWYASVILYCDKKS